MESTNNDGGRKARRRLSVTSIDLKHWWVISDGDLRLCGIVVRFHKRCAMVCREEVRHVEVTRMEAAWFSIQFGFTLVLFLKLFTFTLLSFCCYIVFNWLGGFWYCEWLPMVFMKMEDQCCDGEGDFVKVVKNDEKWCFVFLWCPLSFKG